MAVVVKMFTTDGIFSSQEPQILGDAGAALNERAKDKPPRISSLTLDLNEFHPRFTEQVVEQMLFIFV